MVVTGRVHSVVLISPVSRMQHASIHTAAAYCTWDLTLSALQRFQKNTGGGEEGSGGGWCCEASKAARAGISAFEWVSKDVYEVTGMGAWGIQN